eukprot:11210313-Heterocapsa_arctica.AAC.1
MGLPFPFKIKDNILLFNKEEHMVLQKTGLKHTAIIRLVQGYSGPETKISMILNDRSTNNFSEQTIIEDAGGQMIGETKQKA